MLMKLFNAQQIRDIDRQTIINQKITSDELMERAASRLFNTLKISKNKRIQIFCGVGNNGGDGLVLARLFHQNGYHINCFIVPFSTKTSTDFDINLHRLMQLNINIQILDENFRQSFTSKDLIIDAIFGTGLSRPAEGVAKQAIKLINQSKSITYSVDVPSGLFVDKSNNIDDSIVKSDVVYTFQFPKISFFFPENFKYVKEFACVDIGLDKKVIKQISTNLFLIDSSVKKLLKPRNKFSHKGNFGHALLIGGSYGKIGANILASKAAMKIGAGLVTSYIPRCGYTAFQSSFPEGMVIADKSNKKITSIDLNFDPDAIGIGQGLGTHSKTVQTFKRFLKRQKNAMVLDADALNILAKKPEYIKFIPEKSILTPHPREFKRLVGVWKNDEEKIKKILNFSKKHNIILILKGAYTMISDGKNIYVNNAPNAALAKAGSGDVLTGILTGLLTQNYKPVHAALLGVFLHSETAKKFTKKYHDFAMTAKDIIKELGFK